MNIIEPYRGYAAGNSGPGWPIEPEPDPRPGYSPAGLVLAVVRILAQAGIEVNPGPSALNVAGIAAADLLRALGVAPQTAPLTQSLQSRP